ncbi:hypothetical protein [Sediminicola sp. 1XM1-17]|uniref:hypothetical protein n=1 Tax=Sediminicola sp. 1XM1-17 TaxID=3127702 RepID=UPI003076D10F
MKKVKFYPTIWQTVPYSFDVLGQWETEGKQQKDLVLQSIQATKMGISEMNLNIGSISAIDKDGQEHKIENFPPRVLQIKGLHTGHFLRSKSMLQLPAGEYTAFRFYLAKTGNSFVLSNKSVKPTSRFEFLDFQIEGGLEIRGIEIPEVILRFDFQPYDLPVVFKKIAQFASNTKWFVARLVQSMEQERVKI